MSLHVPPAGPNPEILNAFEAAFITKYLSAAGLGVLLYDHLLTFSSEVSLVWKSPPCFSKYLFLFNRYLVPTSLILAAYQMLGPSLTDKHCRGIIPIVAAMAVLSLGMAEILVLLRVIVLWDRNLRVAGLMMVGFVISFSVTSTLMILAIVKLIDHIQFSPEVSMCVLNKTSPLLVAAWSSPIIFECIVLASTAWNALSQPRTTDIPLARALHRDGMTFFLALTLLRSLNFGFGATFRTELTLMVIFFVWPMAAVVLARSLFRIRRATILDVKLQLPGKAPLMAYVDVTSRPPSPSSLQTSRRSLSERFR